MEEKKAMKNYTFDTTIENEVLQNYLSRSVTAGDLYKSPTLEDDLRAIINMGVKFIGRASGIWKPDLDDDEHFCKTKYLADRVHELDAEIILQACIFEAIYPHIEDFKIPAYVFTDWGMEPEDRGFRFKDMCFPQEPKAYRWKAGAIPDLDRLETRLWFYYRATNYINSGFEALHMGQVHLYTANDRGFVKTQELFDKIREYGKQHGRRHKVLLDAHSHGININGKLLLDYHAMPFTRVPLFDRKGDKLVLVREGFSEGGYNVNGWSANAMPYLMEYDNWGGKILDDFSAYTDAQRAVKDWWGYDQIAWFANQDEEGQSHFLDYTYKWTAINNCNAHFQVPFRRMIESAAVKMKPYGSEIEEVQDFYQINSKSTNCPLGFGQEEVVKKLWEKGKEHLLPYSNPSDLIEYGAKDVFDPETGVKIPQKIVVYGNFQSQVGAVDNDSNSETTRMYYIGNNTYTLSVVIPYAGTYDFAISTYGTLSSTYCYDTYPRSGSSNKSYITTSKDNAIVRFRYVFLDNLVTVDILED